jgi:hypothetical protein
MPGTVPARTSMTARLALLSAFDDELVDEVDGVAKFLVDHIMLL